MGKKSNAKKVNKVRQILIETDGSSIKIIKNETSGNIELLAILQAIITLITKRR